MDKVPFLVGPTASGKTAVALHIAERFKAEIISADSRQIYRGMPIGTAQPTADELTRVPHHFIACLNPKETFSAGEYGRQARGKIIELTRKGITPFVVGGSGLYISALVDDFFSGPSADHKIRDRLKILADKEGVAKLYSDLKEVDPESARKIMPTDYRRIERALEIFYVTGIPISELQRKKANPPPYSPVMVGLDWHREQLYERINSRCLKMLEEGLVDEVEKLIAGKSISGTDLLIEYNALNSVGYVEIIGYLKREYDYDEMVRLFQRNTRRFAKRQISWFGRNQRVSWVEIDANRPAEEAAELALDVLRKNGLFVD
ncbi:tRNA (adenosine(37)-N6)-dimethylallyltransferase MiaA [candidate division LCP-89 bacterium B3_LCP]|uniref:tRNA dimethylallyltransferase n=1 Tax=candidate division LCP-89 bacterium B3_LCP TaxID=2012998 RepID=A0A532V3R3_UNCL8|nr:MAG: tRNA (adenosine(37)-N6)-dimethylallyltransferase MiaA [candidate division LCP-89 bacterium B3_LCP]